MPNTTVLTLTLPTYTPSVETYVVDEATEPNRVTCIEDAQHSPGSRHQLLQTRNNPKINGLSKGIMKTASKFTKDVDSGANDGVSTLVEPILANVEVNMPIGADAGEITWVQEVLIQYIGSTDFINLFSKQRMLNS